jgi:hypothetical protein
MHPVAKLQFERVTREDSLWRSVQVAQQVALSDRSAPTNPRRYQSGCEPVGKMSRPVVDKPNCAYSIIGRALEPVRCWILQQGFFFS